MYPWMLFFIFFLIIAACGSMTTSNKSPFKTEQAMEIWENMTKSERTAANKKSLGFGLFVGAILGLVPCVLGFTLGSIFLSSALNGMILGLFLFPFVLLAMKKKLLRYLAKSWRLFFASTEWARSHGIQAQEIRLFKWEK